MRQKVAGSEQPAWVREARARIERQAAIVKALEPGTIDHQRATMVLLMLTDSLQVLIEARAALASAKSTLGRH